MIRVMIADDQPLVRAGLRMVLAQQPDLTVVGEAGDGRSAIQQYCDLRPDVVLMDTQMPRLDGIAATRGIVAARPVGGPAPRVLIMTECDIDDCLYEALEAGASAILNKDCEPTELIQAIHLMADTEALLPPSISKRLIASFIEAHPRRHPVLPGILDMLTAREREVLELMSTGFSNAEIAAALVISEQTAKTHVSRVLTKLHLRDRVHAVVFGYESGLVRPGRH
ncbi:response regulator [Actinoplanes sp. RD1]|uniref:response regulator n=1 Tax=Actinoplanes sp. RD1 TaxID=3064538 RepID=UPI002741A3AC|nr:response regulator transcription factor [Actinoplanes sp. RD1]